jgi:hypothetical protein
MNFAKFSTNCPGISVTQDVETVEIVVRSLVTSKGSVSADGTDQLGSVPKRVALPALVDQAEIDEKCWTGPILRLRSWVATFIW